ncbi:Rrf2 family transcriptional regulator [Anaerobacillus isosaccharinicus]|uniref:HTH-type transcriptional regulator NsrR n=1 Tax=Anaerobacillus isosaccharinicus TaxID=1532552 RepID=A0A1S2MES3_9BACI|nr:Rrf2 family transcriptional regulator [Anaerobacillus isosaccharinicus]MBA5586717.1 Rrf2 family transcriptional regulator [Anaerobacillus isosaccharinicus]QOY35060.1 Rrf2 family transcriptional regulator [Anaerobacillus isosaccharinicus]
MHLTAFTDYSLRVLLYLGNQPEDKLSNIKEIATIYKISNNHLSKIVFELGKLDLIETNRGRNGGIRLAKPASQINIGWVIQQTEDNLELVECFNKHNNACILTAACRLKHVLNEALVAYLQVLSSYTLEDLLLNKDELQSIFQLEASKNQLI